VLEKKVDERLYVKLCLLTGWARRLAWNDPAGYQFTFGYTVWNDPVGLGQDFIVVYPVLDREYVLDHVVDAPLAPVGA
jgi:hypothetical protein